MSRAGSKINTPPLFYGVSRRETASRGKERKRGKRNSLDPVKPAASGGVAAAERRGGGGGGGETTNRRPLSEVRKKKQLMKHRGAEGRNSCNTSSVFFRTRFDFVLYVLFFFSNGNQPASLTTRHATSLYKPDAHWGKVLTHSTLTVAQRAHARAHTRRTDHSE